MKICAIPGCENYTQNDRMDHCASCSTKIRKQAKIDAMEPKKHKPIASQSPKRKVEDNRYKELSKVYMNNHPHCQAKLAGICTGRSAQLHHVKGRGIHLNDVESFLAVCEACHFAIHNILSAVEARELNLKI